MPITAYSNEASRELDLDQWLKLNGYDPKVDPELLGLPTELRIKAASDIECSCCGARGATLVRAARSKGSGKTVGQSHFRFRSPDGANAHDPLCDFFDEQKVRGAEYLTDFRSDKTAQTKAIRDLVCRGINAGLFSQADMRSMRLWFLQEKAAHAVTLDVTPELLQWCVEMETARWAAGIDSVPFTPEHGLLPNFDWELAAKHEWVRRNKHLFEAADTGVFFRRQSTERPLRLIAQYAGQLVLDPSALREKYEAACQLSRFAAMHLFGRGMKPPEITRRPVSEWGRAGESLFALSALLLFVCGWDLQRASALYCRLRVVSADPDGLQGNLIGLNPFHDYHAWQVINSAQRIAAKRIDGRSVPLQIADVMTELQAEYHKLVV